MAYDFKKYLYWSFGFHAAALLFLLIAPYLPFQTFRIREEKVTWITLPRGTGDDLGSIKKALDLPKTTIQQQKQPPPKVEAPKPSTMKYTEKRGAPKPSVEKQKSEEALRIEQALAKARQQVASRPVVPEAAQIPASAAGGVPEGSAVGAVVPPDDPEKVLYQLKIREKIKQEWIPPLKLADPSLGLICKLILRINERGEVLETKIEESSGNEAYDQSALRAVTKSPFVPPPPERLKWEAIHEGILVEFNPSLLQSLGQ